MRKAGAKVGSIGSKGAVDVNSSPVSTAVAGRPSNLMIKFCTCTGRLSSSSLHNLENTDISMTCKGCTGESADRGGPSCSGKLNNMGLELPRPIDLQVRWKTGRQRATRRARTFFGEGTSRDGIGSFYLFGCATNQEMSQDAAVSESEKLGVSILGRRFSDPMENVPIKKRRFHMDCSPSPPPTPLLVDPYEKILGISSKAVISYEKHCKLKRQGIEYKDESKGRFGADDFSGIDILASAACESEMGGEILNGECSKLAHLLEERKLENTTCSSKFSLLHNMEDKLNIPGTSHCIYDRPLGSSNSAPDMKSLFVATPTISENLVELASAPKVNGSFYSALNSPNKTEIVSDAKSSSVAIANSSDKPEKTIGCSQDTAVQTNHANVPAKSSSVAIANSSDNPEKTIGCSQDTVVQTNHGNVTRDSRLHWDLNVAMEAWDTDCGDVDDPLVSTVSGHDDARNDMDKPGTSHHFELRDGSVAHSVDTIHMADALRHVSANTKDTCDCPADDSSHPSQNLHLLESGSVGNNALAETMDLPHQQNSRFGSVMDSDIRSDQEPPIIMKHFASAANVEKINGSHPQPVHSEGLSNMSSMNVHVGSNSLQTSELDTTLKPLASRLVSEDSTNLPTTIVDPHIRSDPEPALIMDHFASAANVEKIDGSYPQPVHSKGLSNISSMNVHVGSNSLQTSELGITVKPLASRLVSEESTNLPTAIMDSHIRSDPEPALIIEHFASAVNVEKIDGSYPQPVHSEGLSNIMSSMNLHVGSNSLQTSELGTTVKPLASRLVSEESTNLPTVGTSHKKVTDFGWSDNMLEEASEQSISESKNQELLDVDSGTSKKGEHDNDIFYANKRTKDAENLTHPEDKHGSSDCDMAHAHEEDGAVAKIDSKDSLITCANSSTLETYHISDEAQVPVPSSECHKPEFIADAGSTVDSKAAAHSYQNGCENELGKAVSNVCLDQCYETDTSHISKNLAGVEKVDVEDDDSQYEDGELRESGDCYWVGGGYEEGKHANWHYQVSDYKNEEATPGLAPPLHTDSIAKNVVIPVANYNRTQSRKEDVAVSPVSSKRSWLTNCIDGRPIADGKAQSIHLRGDTKMYGSNAGRVAVRSATTVSKSERCNDALGADMLNIRIKNTSWDMTPEDQKHSQHDARDGTDSSNQCVLSSDVARDDVSLRRKGVSNRDLQRVERQKSFERPQRNELSRSDDGYGSGSKSERTMDSHRSHGMYGASRHVQTSGRGEWVENSKHSRSTQHKSPEYYNYGPSGPRNAAEAAVAKMESSGFVVARDGTLVRAVDATNPGQMPRRMRNTLSSSGHLISGRGSPIDRDGACGMSRRPIHAREASPERQFGANNRSSRYGPEMEKDHTADGNLSSVRCSLSSRQRGIPTSRASLNLSRAHSRSPSGSRSRSPHDWAPRNRSKIMANGGSTLRRHSRSPPNHMAKGRIVRMASPQRQPGYDDRAMRYSPLSRNNTYSQHASTWVDGRNSSAVDISDGHNKRYSRRSPPLRITSRNDRFDVMDSEGRPRSGEFYHPTQGRLLYGYDRENKHDRNGEDERGYTDRYANHSVKPYDRSGAVKQFRNNNTGDKFRTRISAPRSPELQRRVSPRRFDRSFER